MSASGTLARPYPTMCCPPATQLNMAAHAARCIPDLKDECAEDHGGCWHGDFTVNGESRTFHACKDNIDVYKARALRRAASSNRGSSNTLGRINSVCMQHVCLLQPRRLLPVACDACW